MFSASGLLLNLAITLVMYSFFPILYAYIRRKEIESFHYRAKCFIFNLIIGAVMVAFFGGVANGAPYILWTFVFSSIGKRILTNRGLLYVL